MLALRAVKRPSRVSSFSYLSLRHSSTASTASPLSQTSPFPQESAPSDEIHSTPEGASPPSASSSPPKKPKSSKRQTPSEKRETKLKELDAWTNKSQAFLAKLDPAPPTLEHLLALKPPLTSLQIDNKNSPIYLDLYNKTVKALKRSFDRSQLLHFSQELNLRAPPSGAKDKIITSILKDAWNMPVPPSLKRTRISDIERGVPLSPGELFLLLGKDGSDILQLAVEFKVKIKPILQPLSLSICGPPSHVKRLEKKLESRKASITTEIFTPEEMPGMTADLVNVISRTARAYVQLINDGKISVMAESPERIAAAKRLALRAAFNDLDSKAIPTTLHLDTASDDAGVGSYSMHPFATSRPPPWTMNNGSLFRMQRVREAPDWPHHNQDEHPPKPLAQFEDLQTMLWPNGSSFDGLTRSITAWSGHVLAPSTRSRSLVSPVQGTSSSAALLNGLAKDGKGLSFMHGAPVNSRSTLGEAREVRRLVYRILPLDGSTAKTQTVIVDSISPSSDSSLVGTRRSKLHCRSGLEHSVHLLLPDRALDLKFSVFDHQEVQSYQFSSTMKIFLRKLEEGSRTVEAPSTMYLDGTKYHLSENLLLYQGLGETRDQARQVTEKICDLETGGALFSEKIETAPNFKLESWSAFMGLCDRITSHDVSKAPLGRLPVVAPR